MQDLYYSCIKSMAGWLPNLYSFCICGCRGKLSGERGGAFSAMPVDALFLLSSWTTKVWFVQTEFAFSTIFLTAGFTQSTLFLFSTIEDVVQRRPAASLQTNTRDTRVPL